MIKNGAAEKAKTEREKLENSKLIQSAKAEARLFILQIYNKFFVFCVFHRKTRFLMIFKQYLIM